MHTKKSKTSGHLKKTFFSFLGTKRTSLFLKYILEKKQSNSLFSFPIDISTIHEILIILPEQHLTVLHQLRNIIALTTLFKHAGITLLCERHVSAYIKMIPGLSIVEYDIDEHYSVAFSEMARQFKNIDICFLLDETPSLPILYFTGTTGATIRVGYYGAGNYPFLNLHIRPSKNNTLLSDRYASMITLFGIKQKDLKWRVAKKTIEEVDHLIKEQKISPNAPLIAFDALHFINILGDSWTETFLKRIREQSLGIPYMVACTDPHKHELAWIQNQNMACFSDLSTSRLAALVSKSRLIISGNTSMYALAGLLHRPAVGMFKEEDLAAYCPQNSLQKGVVYTEKDQTVLINHLLSTIQVLLKSSKT